MARRTLIAGNWKLHKSIAESVAFGETLAARLGTVAGAEIDVVLAPPYPSLFPLAQAVAGSSIQIAAQEVFSEDSGAYTGAVSAAMVRDAGCAWTLVGHSERRQLFGETVASTAIRLATARTAGLKSIFCVGETQQERDAGQTDRVLAQQLEALEEGPAWDTDVLAIAYEPVWAIGTGKVASEADAQSVHGFIRDYLAKGDAVDADRVRLLYGGSVKPANAGGLLSQPDIDGVLVGGASLDVESFARIIAAHAPGNYEAWFDAQFS